MFRLLPELYSNSLPFKNLTDYISLFYLNHFVCIRLFQPTAINIILLKQHTPAVSYFFQLSANLEIQNHTSSGQSIISLIYNLIFQSMSHSSFFSQHQYLKKNIFFLLIECSNETKKTPQTNMLNLCKWSLKVFLVLK